MKISISNIASVYQSHSEFYELLKKEGIDYVDVAPTKLFSGWDYTESQVRQARLLLDDFGLKAMGMQSLLYGLPELNVFANPKSKYLQLRAHFERLCALACALGVTHLVLGSPKGRDISGCTMQQAIDFACERFNDLAELCGQNGLTLCIEPVATRLGGNFLVSTQETVDFVRDIGHPNLKINLDTAVLFEDGTKPYETVYESYDAIGHVHISEPDLNSFECPQCDHDEVSNALRECGYTGTLAIEMLTEPLFAAKSICEAACYAKSLYGK